VSGILHNIAKHAEANQVRLNCYMMLLGVLDIPITAVALIQRTFQLGIYGLSMSMSVLKSIGAGVIITSQPGQGSEILVAGEKPCTGTL